jgi:hypothetical protein
LARYIYLAGDLDIVYLILSSFHFFPPSKMKSFAFSLLALFSSTALAVDPGYISHFQIITSVRANQPASAAKYDKLLLQGGEYGGPSRTNTARLANTSYDYFYYNGTHISSQDGGLSGGFAFIPGLKLREPESLRELWTPVTATIWMTDDGRQHTEYFKVVPEQPIVWTNPPSPSGYGVNWQGWLGKLAQYSTLLR